MKKRIMIYTAIALVLAALILVIIIGTKPEKEIFSGAKLVFREMHNEMKETDQTDIVVQQDKCENEIFRDAKEDPIGY